MNYFNQPGEEDDRDESLEIVDLDNKDPRQRGRIEAMLAALYWHLARHRRRYIYIGLILLILFGVIFVEDQNHQPITTTTNGDLAVITISSPTVMLYTTAQPVPVLPLLQRPLKLPRIAPGASCPTTKERQVNAQFGITQGNGPVYATIGTETIESPAILRYTTPQHFMYNEPVNIGWGGAKVLWFVSPDYKGPILVRGQQIDGPHAIRFLSDLTTNQPIAQELVFDTASYSGDSFHWPNFGFYTLLQAPGCYAYQVDGINFSYVIIFKAVVQQ
jgi:hypothetical protein